MSRLLVFQHVAAEPLGTLDPLIRRRGHRIRFVNFDRHPDAEPALDRYRGLIVLGGPMNVEDQHARPHLRFELRAIEQALAAGKPVLGICLGAQLLAHVLGAPVRRMGRPEIGWHRIEATEAGRLDPVLAALAPDTDVFQWHGCHFEIPACAVQLARGSGCEQQAFRYGDSAYGLQFHPEVDQALIERWLGNPAYREDLSKAGIAPQCPNLQSSTRQHIDTLRTRAETAFNAFLDQVGRPQKRIVLPSR